MKKICETPCKPIWNSKDTEAEKENGMKKQIYQKMYPLNGD